MFLAMLLPFEAFAAGAPMREIKFLHQKSDPKVQFALTFKPRDGIGAGRNDSEAMRWVHQSADSANANSIAFSGLAHLHGAEMARRPEIVFGSLKSAANESAPAAFNLDPSYYGNQAKGMLSRPVLVIGHL